jgi:ankyrin repeat protein
MMALKFSILLLILSINLFFSYAEQEDEFIPSILLESVVNGDVTGIARAVEAGESIDLTNDRGWSAARFAVNLGDLESLRELINNSIDLNNPDDGGVTPLMAAAGAVSLFCIFISFLYILNSKFELGGSRNGRSITWC